MEIVDKDIYRADYESVTSRVLEEQIPYDVAIVALEEIAASGRFEE